MTTMIAVPHNVPLPEEAFFREANKESKLKLQFEIRNDDEVTILLCRGRVTYREEAVALSGKVGELSPEARQLVLDLSGVETMDSAGLGELVAALRWIRESGGSIKLAAPRRQVRLLLDLTNLSSVFEVHPSLQEAVLSFRGQPA
jgi:anti-sigma B factor antagonist